MPDPRPSCLKSWVGGEGQWWRGVGTRMGVGVARGVGIGMGMGVGVGFGMGVAVGVGLQTGADSRLEILRG